MKQHEQSIQDILKTLVDKAPTIAVIQEEACIGCFKCINACPVDAIVGSAQRMHTVIPENCIGCDLCITACPVNCITAEAADHPPEINLAITRNTNKLQRLSLLSDYERSLYREHTFQESSDPLADKKAAIAAAIARVHDKPKSDKNLRNE